MLDSGARYTDDRLRALDKRLQSIYSAAYETAIENEAAAIAKLAALDVEALRAEGLTDTQIRAKQLAYKAQVERETQMTKNIAAEIAKSGETAAKIIRGERLNVYDINYRKALSSIDKQLGFEVDWTLYDKNQLKAILDGELEPFSKVRFREKYVGWEYVIDENGKRKIDLITGKPMRRSIYASDRAFGMLGNNKPIINRLQNELTQSIILGEGIPKIAKRIRNVADVSYRQAVRIARTETLKVANQGRMTGYYQAYEEYGIDMDKQWIATLDSRTRDTHAHMHMEKVPLDEEFSNGLMQPGDPNGPAEEIINCRCAVVSVLSGLKGSKAYQELNERIGKKT